MREIPAIEYALVCDCGIKYAYGHEEFLKHQADSFQCKCGRLHTLAGDKVLSTKITYLTQTDNLLEYVPNN